jgi:hypothetical protein
MQARNDPGQTLNGDLFVFGESIVDHAADDTAETGESETDFKFLKPSPGN